MTNIKPTVERDVIEQILAEHFDEHPTQLEPIEIGQIARTFSLHADGADYILRFNTRKLDANFEKEAFVAATYGSDAVPIPQVVAHGRCDGLHYCITRKAPGRCLDQLTPEETKRALPQVMAVLNAIHATDVTGQAGFGLFDGEGKGFFDRWPASLMGVKDEEREDGFFGRWHRLFETTFLERKVFDDLYARFSELLEYCPNERHLVHAGFGFGNVLIEDGCVSAVIDWIDAKYGDFLYDVAWLDYYDPERNYSGHILSSYAERDIEIVNARERLLCYQCYIALDGMRFFALVDKQADYEWTKARILNLLSRSHGRCQSVAEPGAYSASLRRTTP